MTRILDGIDRAWCAVFASSRARAEERVVVAVAALGFLVHLGLVAWRQLGLGPELAWFSSSYLAALYTPFSFLLFYEVLLLVRALPASFSRSMAILYEVITLIVLRRVFKDIAGLDAAGEIALTDPAVVEVAADMVGSLVLFGLTLLFRRQLVPAEPPTGALRAFVAFKQVLALLLAVLVVGLAAWSLWGWVNEMAALAAGQDVGLSNVNAVFYEDFFGLLVLVDVLLLVVSFAFVHGFAQVFRNAGYVASTVLVRLSFQAGRLESLALLLFAVAVGLGVQALARMAGSRDADEIRDVEGEASAEG
jgi:hypothetical protein